MKKLNKFIKDSISDLLVILIFLVLFILGLLIVQGIGAGILWIGSLF